MLLCSVALTACNDTVANMFGIVPDMEGEAVTFTTDLRTPRPSTRAAFADKTTMDKELGSYKAINENYDLTISMYKDGSDEVVASSKYSPTPTTNNGTANGFDSKGILSLQAFEGNKVMYWPDNVNEYGFKATCGTATVEADQSNWTKLIAQDALLGYAYGASYGVGADDIETMNYHTNKEWYKLNQARLEGVDGATTEDYQRIPLYLRHQRSWLTIILKAGNGVKREFLQEANKDNLVTTLFSHGDSKVTINKPLTTYTNIHYDEDINGSAGDVQTTKYDAIVEPYDYSSNLETEICKVVVNNMKFTYYASNDGKIGTADEDMSVYNLTAGKHLTITATLSTDRIVHITALLEDWDEMTFNSICDDYGQNGDPIMIPDRGTLARFLADENLNKAGNTAIISAANLNLTDTAWNAYNLEATLNLAGATIVTNKQFLNKVGNNSTVVNGVIQLTGESTAVPAVLCSENHGTIQQVTIATDGKAKANKGSVCDVNYGTIYNCTSYLAVQGTGSDQYVGGIAAKSMWDDGAATKTQPIIDKCVVNGRVGAASSETVLGVGGIVGYAEGRLSNNTFNYGITIMHQGIGKNQNIVAATSAEESKKLNSDRAYNNAWPTIMANDLAGTNANTTALYRAVLDCQEELAYLINLGNSAKDQKYRVAADFDVDNTWTYGQTEATGTSWTDGDPIYNHTFVLDGNNHTITTHGKMLFSHINGEIMNLKIYCAESIIDPTNATSTNVIAPLAYSVNGATAKLTNVKVRMADGKYIQASQPSGLVCCAYDGAVINGCEVEVDLRSRMNHDDDSEREGEGHDARRYMGGLAAFATNAEFVGCTVHSGTKMLEVIEGTEVKHSNLFIGGLVGGTTIKNNVDPSLLIHDCTSWWGSDEKNCGAIIGKTTFTKGNKDTNGMREGCQGNWWTSGNPAGDLGTSYEKILGKKNSVGLNQDSDDWWK